MLYIHDTLRRRCWSVNGLLNIVKSFTHKIDIQYQPAHKLYQAIVHSITKNMAFDTNLSKLNLGSPFQSEENNRDQRATLGGNLLEIKVRYLVFENSFKVI